VTTLCTVRFETLGCRLNQLETEGAAKAFFDAGFTPLFNAPAATPAPDDAGAVLCVVNTCSVTGKAEQKARRSIRRLLETNPNAAMLVTGCYAELDAAFLSALDSRIAVLSGKQKQILADIPAKYRAFLQNTECEAAPGDGQGKHRAAFLSALIHANANASETGQPTLAQKPFRLSTDTFFAHSRPLVKIQEGCDNFCSYCAIRLARGKSVSLDALSVIAQIRTLETQGQQEVVLTGVNLCQYAGEYQGGSVDFTALLELILENTSAIALRISSLRPDYIDGRFCSAIRDARVRPHFHLSVQSGSNTVLAAMNRPYTAAQTAEAAARLREAKRNPFIACDIIAGFPGETDRNFEDTLELCRRCDFAWIHAFPFSPRPGTPAFSMKKHVQSSVTQERVSVLTELAIARKITYINSFTGQSLPAIIERPRENKPANQPLRGVTENFIHVELAAGQEQRAHKTTVRIIKPLEEHIRQGDEIEAAAVFPE
jgi:threonylcarbamoyladenosine tRNA methylthiotransferase MtaB